MAFLTLGGAFVCAGLCASQVVLAVANFDSSGKPRHSEIVKSDLRHFGYVFTGSAIVTAFVGAACVYFFATS